MSNVKIVCSNRENLAFDSSENYQHNIDWAVLKCYSMTTWGNNVTYLNNHHHSLTLQTPWKSLLAQSNAITSSALMADSDTKFLVALLKRRQ